MKDGGRREEERGQEFRRARNLSPIPPNSPEKPSFGLLTVPLIMEMSEDSLVDTYIYIYIHTIHI